MGDHDIHFSTNFRLFPKNDFNLNIPRYIDSQEEEDIQDIEAHLKGGIPLRDIDALGEYWKVCPNLRETLFVKNKRDGYCDLKVEDDEIKLTIYSHPEFIKFGEKIQTIFSNWEAEQTAILKNLKVGAKPVELIHEISEAILCAFTNVDLVDKYDIYQHVMTYWLATMKDDLYMIAEDGWKAEVTEIIKEKGKQNKKVEGTIKIGKSEYICELIPTNLVVAKYFAKEQQVYGAPF